MLHVKAIQTNQRSRSRVQMTAHVNYSSTYQSNQTYQRSTSQSNPNVQISVDIISIIAVAHIQAINAYQCSVHQSNPSIQIAVEIISISPLVNAIKTYQRSTHQSNSNIQIPVETNSSIVVAPIKAI